MLNNIKNKAKKGSISKYFNPIFPYFMSYRLLERFHYTGLTIAKFIAGDFSDETGTDFK